MANLTLYPPQELAERAPTPKCRSCGCPASRRAVAFEKWHAEHAGVVPRILSFCHDGEDACCRIPLDKLVWADAADILNFSEMIGLSRLEWTNQAKHELDELIEGYFQEKGKHELPKRRY